MSLLQNPRPLYEALIPVVNVLKTAAEESDRNISHVCCCGHVSSNTKQGQNQDCQSQQASPLPDTEISAIAGSHGAGPSNTEPEDMSSAEDFTSAVLEAETSVPIDEDTLPLSQAQVQVANDPVMADEISSKSGAQAGPIPQAISELYDLGCDLLSNLTYLQEIIQCAAIEFDHDVDTNLVSRAAEVLGRYHSLASRDKTTVPVHKPELSPPAPDLGNPRPSIPSSSSSSPLTSTSIGEEAYNEDEDLLVITGDMKARLEARPKRACKLNKPKVTQCIQSDTPTDPPSGLELVEPETSVKISELDGTAKQTELCERESDLLGASLATTDTKSPGPLRNSTAEMANPELLESSDEEIPMLSDVGPGIEYQAMCKELDPSLDDDQARLEQVLLEEFASSRPRSSDDDVDNVIDGPEEVAPALTEDSSLEIEVCVDHSTEELLREPVNAGDSDLDCHLNDERFAKDTISDDVCPEHETPHNSASEVQVCVQLDGSFDSESSDIENLANGTIARTKTEGDSNQPESTQNQETDYSIPEKDGNGLGHIFPAHRTGILPSESTNQNTDYFIPEEDGDGLGHIYITHYAGALLPDSTEPLVPLDGTLTNFGRAEGNTERQPNTIDSTLKCKEYCCEEESIQSHATNHFIPEEDGIGLSHVFPANNTETPLSGSREPQVPLDGTLTNFGRAKDFADFLPLLDIDSDRPIPKEGAVEVAEPEGETGATANFLPILSDISTAGSGELSLSVDDTIPDFGETEDCTKLEDPVEIAAEHQQPVEQAATDVVLQEEHDTAAVPPAPTDSPDRHLIEPPSDSESIIVHAIGPDFAMEPESSQEGVEEDFSQTLSESEGIHVEGVTTSEESSAVENTPFSTLTRKDNGYQGIGFDWDPRPAQNRPRAPSTPPKLLGPLDFEDPDFDVKYPEEKCDFFHELPRTSPRSSSTPPAIDCRKISDYSTVNETLTATSTAVTDSRKVSDSSTVNVTSRTASTAASTSSSQVSSPPDLSPAGTPVKGKTMESASPSSSGSPAMALTPAGTPTKIKVVKSGNPAETSVAQNKNAEKAKKKATDANTPEPVQAKAGTVATKKRNAQRAKAKAKKRANAQAEGDREVKQVTEE